MEPQPEPANLLALKAELALRWPMTSLLDMLKETSLRVGFTEAFRSATAWENLDEETLQQRLLLCLYGLGTNAGIKRMSAGDANVAYKDLLYVKRPLHYQGPVALCHRPGGQRDASRAESPDLGRRHDGLRFRFQEIRGMGPESDDRMARPLWRARRDDLLARRSKIALHLLAAQDLFFVGGGRHDRGRDTALHGDVR